MNAEHEPSESMIGQAAQWLALLHDDAVSSADRQAFNAWRHADPRHALAFTRMQAVMGSFEQLPAKPARKALGKVFPPAKGKISPRPLQAIALLGVLFFGWLGANEAPVWLADERTNTGERRDILLTDGSELRLNSGSALDVEFDERRRVIELYRGEMWVQVAKDQQRPFVVKTSQGTITALGTRFVVRKGQDGSVQVSVLESAVAANADRLTDVRVNTGQRATLMDGVVQAPNAIGNDDPAAWTRGLLKANDRPLGEVLQALGAYRRGVLQFDEQAMQGIRVSGVFRLDDTDAALATLADNLPIKVEHFTPLFVRVKPAN
ncbi:iron dicitrate transport regulator FecR [Pseudomonas sp. S25]|uniref:Iron dicitrate transport regulator FecR n=1 Tax=Pseudomonas maioricensis TaxID=1766623 RepID=A0ABS9ZG83_9PSED|nr:FecR family protein [Pseudomonas sp. S25]MCI8209640.1 iron dicitrate transport regulator FecR [Pseudomonas sp. S25]